MPRKCSLKSAQNQFIDNMSQKDGSAGDTLMNEVKRSKWRCSECRDYEGLWEQLEAHAAADHLYWLPYECAFCSWARFPTEPSLRFHLRTNHSEQKSAANGQWMIFTADDNKREQLDRIMLRSEEIPQQQQQPSSVHSIRFHRPESVQSSIQFASSTPVKFVPNDAYKPYNGDSCSMKSSARDKQSRDMAAAYQPYNAQPPIVFLHKVPGRGRPKGAVVKNELGHNASGNIAQNNYVLSRSNQRDMSSDVMKREEGCGLCGKQFVKKFQHVTLAHLPASSLSQASAGSAVIHSEIYRSIFRQCFPTTKLPGDANRKMMQRNAVDMKWHERIVADNLPSQLPTQTSVQRSSSNGSLTMDKSIRQNTIVKQHQPVAKVWKLRKQTGAQVMETSVSDILGLINKSNDSKSLDKPMKEKSVAAYCQICGATVHCKGPETGPDNAFLLAHVYRQHLNRNTVLCAYCEYGVPYSTVLVEKHIMSVHEGRPVKLVNKREQHAAAAHKLLPLCFPGTPLIDANVASVSPTTPLVSSTTCKSWCCSLKNASEQGNCNCNGRNTSTVLSRTPAGPFLPQSSCPQFNINTQQPIIFLNGVTTEQLALFGTTRPFNYHSKINDGNNEQTSSQWNAFQSQKSKIVELSDQGTDATLPVTDTLSANVASKRKTTSDLSLTENRNRSVIENSECGRKKAALEEPLEQLLQSAHKSIGSETAVDLSRPVRPVCPDRASHVSRPVDVPRKNLLLTSPNIHSPSLNGNRSLTVAPKAHNASALNQSTVSSSGSMSDALISNQKKLYVKKKTEAVSSVNGVNNEDVLIVGCSNAIAVNKKKVEEGWRDSDKSRQCRLCHRQILFDLLEAHVSMRHSPPATEYGRLLSCSRCKYFNGKDMAELKAHVVHKHADVDMTTDLAKRKELLTVLKESCFFDECNTSAVQSKSNDVQLTKNEPVKRNATADIVQKKSENYTTVVSSGPSLSQSKITASKPPVIARNTREEQEQQNRAASVISVTVPTKTSLASSSIVVSRSRPKPLPSINANIVKSVENHIQQSIRKVVERSAEEDRRGEKEQFLCALCEEVHRGDKLNDHVYKRHAPRHRCSLCSFKSPFLEQLRCHSKAVHNLTNGITWSQTDISKLVSMCFFGGPTVPVVAEKNSNHVRSESAEKALKTSTRVMQGDLTEKKEGPQRSSALLNSTIAVVETRQGEERKKADNSGKKKKVDDTDDTDDRDDIVVVAEVPEGKMKCLKCEMLVNEQLEAARKHILSVHVNGYFRFKFRCPYCPGASDDYNRVQVHIKNEGKGNKPPIDNRDNQRKRLLKELAETFPDLSRHQMTVSLADTDTAQLVRAVLISEKPGVCSLCRQVAPRPSHHVWMHLGQKPFLCPLCPFGAFDELSVNQHSQRMHREMAKEPISRWQPLRTRFFRMATDCFQTLFDDNWSPFNVSIQTDRQNKAEKTARHKDSSKDPVEAKRLKLDSQSPASAKEMSEDKKKSGRRKTMKSPTEYRALVQGMRCLWNGLEGDPILLEKFNCQDCQKLLPAHTTVFHVYRKHVKEKTFQCGHCSVKFSVADRSSIPEQHMLNEHNGQQFAVLDLRQSLKTDFSQTINRCFPEVGAKLHMVEQAEKATLNYDDGNDFDDRVQVECVATQNSEGGLSNLSQDMAAEREGDEQAKERADMDELRDILGLADQLLPPVP